MNIQVNRIELLDALNVAGKCLEKTNTVPILKSFLLKAGANLTIQATDYDKAVSVPVECVNKTTDDAAVCVDGRLLINVVSRIKNETLDLSITNDSFGVKGDKVKLRTTKAEAFPDPPFETELYPVSFKTSEFAELCKSASMAMVEDAVFPYASVAHIGVSRNLIEGKFNCQSTDRNRLAVVTGLCDTEETEPFFLDLPLFGIRTLQPILKKHEVIEFGQDNNHIFARIGESNFSFRKIGIKFPNVQSLLDQLVFERVVKVNAEEFTNAFELVGCVLDPRLRRVQVDVDGDLTLSAKGADLGEIEEVLEVNADFEPFSTGYNYDYILPVLKQTEGEIDLQFAKVNIKNSKGESTGHYWLLRIAYERNGVSSNFDIAGLA